MTASEIRDLVMTLDGNSPLEIRDALVRIAEHLGDLEQRIKRLDGNKADRPYEPRERF